MSVSYRVIWMSAFPAPMGRPGPNVCPMLCSEEYLAKMQEAPAGQSMQLPEIDFLGGIAHELWKDEQQLETPKAALRAEWERICGVMGWGDDKEARWVSVTDHCRERYGEICSMYQIFSAVEACPMSVQLNHNLLVNVMSLMQAGKFEELSEDAWRQTLRTLRHVSDIVPVTHFRDHEYTAFIVTTLYAVALASEGDTEKVRAFTNFASTNVLTNPKWQFNAHEITAMSEDDAVMCLRAVANSNASR